jgi:hypothetical protein
MEHKNYRYIWDVSVEHSSASVLASWRAWQHDRSCQVWPVVSQGLCSFVWLHQGNRWQRCLGTVGGYCRCSRTGGPSTCRSARSTKRKDKDSPSGGQTEALPADRPPLPSGEEPSASPLAGRRQRQPLPGLQIAQAVALLSHRRWERASGKWRRARDANGMVKARVSPAIELLEHVMRVPRPASSEALPWWQPFALSHFLEGVQDDCNTPTFLTLFE